jgi:two-component system sensor kinase FixL
LPTLIDEAIQLNAHAIQSAGIQTHVELPWLPEIYVSKSKTTQVLVNLVRNAIQAMSGQPADNRHLTIKGRLVDEVDLEIEIQDTGCGFSEEVQQKLFRHGFTTKESGNGLGLPWRRSRRYIQDSTRQCDSAPTHDDTFIVERPVL